MMRDVLTRLGDYGLRRTGEGRWESRCPAHDDRSPSLSIGTGAEGRVLLKCFAGCETSAIVAAIGLTERDLFEDDGKGSVHETLPEDQWPVVATYEYEDPAGDPVFRVLRKQSPDSGRKTFRQERHSGTKWISGMDGVERVLYKLPRLLDNPDETVLLAEGEKDVENLTSLGFVATTNPGGAGKWLPQYTETLRGRNVVIIPDNDKPGLAHAEAVSKALTGAAKSIKVLRLPALGDKGDVSDWLKTGGTAAELKSLIAKADGPRQFFESSANRIVGERRERLEMGKKVLRFGVSFLDHALGGIMTRDLLIFGAKTGVGKTSLATMAALANCQDGRRVHYFALEAEDREIERRMKFQILSGLYYQRQHREHAEHSAYRLRFLDWYQGKLDHVVGDLEDEADEKMRALTANLKTYYRIDSFTSEDFCAQLASIKDETDLVVLDHLHYVDSDDDNENRGYKKIVKQIRDSALRFEKPVIVVAHVRKSDRRQAQLVPDIEDFHGSSDVPKMATKAVMLAPDYETKTGDSGLWSTFMHISKCRADNSVTRYLARIDFNIRKNQYEEEYQIGRLTDNGKAFSELVPDDRPTWFRGQLRRDEDLFEDG